MKRSATALMALAFAASILSCNNDDDHHPAPGIGGSMSAQINGSSWAATEAKLSQPAGAPVEFYGMRSATVTQATAIYVHLQPYSGLAEYPFNGGGSWASYVEDNVAFVASNGKTTVILDNDTFFKASFIFDASDTTVGNTRTISGSFTYRKK